MVPEARSVWIVDDSALDAEMARRVLARDFTVEVFDDGGAVLEALAQTPDARPDVIVLDWLMPGVSGIEVCRYLRDSPDESLRRVGILLVTVHRQTDLVVEGLGAGANDFMSKPYAEDELRARVGVLVRNRRLAERVERAEAALAHLLANSPDPLIGIDDDGFIHFANTRAEAALGRDRDTLRNTCITTLLPSLKGWLETDEPSDLTSPSGSWRAGSDIAIDGRVYAPTAQRASAGGEITHVLSLRDVTLQRQAEQRRIDFYSVIAHDLRSPLSAMQLRHELLLRGGCGPLPEAAHTSVARLKSSTAQLIALINDFLDLARLDSGAKLGGDALVDTAQLIAETADDLLTLATAARIALHLEPTTVGQLTVLGDFHRLKQALTNLVTNAIKFTGADGHVTIGARQRDAMVEIVVADTGRGIAAEKLPVIFDRYSRALDDDREVIGSGLGLMIVKEIVAAHHGRVDVESTVGEGSRFTILLPLAQPLDAAP